MRVNSTDEHLRLDSENGKTRIRGERSEFHLPSENPDEFPSVASFEEENYHEVSARLLKELIRRTLFATDTESSRYALGGVLLEFVENQIIAVGTERAIEAGCHCHKPVLPGGVNRRIIGQAGQGRYNSGHHQRERMPAWRPCITSKAAKASR